MIKEIKGAGIVYGEPLGRHTSLGIGGKAEIFARPESEEALSALLASGLQLPVCFLGGGTNLLLPDGDIKALFISTAALKGIEVLAEGSRPVLSVRAGEPLKSVLAFCMKRGFGGLEPLAGIPGSFGGAVAGNAGAHGAQMKDFIRRVHVMDARGGITAVTNERMGFRYRGSCLLDDGVFTKGGGLVIKAEVMLGEGDPAEIKKMMLENFELKKKTQPLSERSAGCVFKNPPGYSAGKLIDEAGLKGARVGGIEVSAVHANFFINKGDGRADDFLKLMDKVAREVKERTGVLLEPEIRIFNF